MVEAKVCSTPCSTGSFIDSISDKALCSSNDATTAYRSIVGALHYLTFTRPDISFVVSKVSQFMHSPTYSQLASVKRILRYMRGTLHLSLHLRAGTLNLSAFSDSDWAGNPNDRRSTTEFVVFLGANPIS